MAATFRRTLLAGLLLLNTGTAIAASPITPEAAADQSNAVILKETAVSFSTSGSAAIQMCPGGCSDDQTAAIPEPAALFLLGIGVVLLTTHRRRRRRMSR
jgi:PEP-CTERM motif